MADVHFYSGGLDLLELPNPVVVECGGSIDLDYHGITVMLENVDCPHCIHVIERDELAIKAGWASHDDYLECVRGSDA